MEDPDDTQPAAQQPTGAEQRAIALFCQCERQAERLREAARANKKALAEERRGPLEAVEGLLGQLGLDSVCFENPAPPGAAGGAAPARLRAFRQATSYPKRITRDLVRQSVERLTEDELRDHNTVGAIAQRLFGHLQAVRTVRKTKIVVREVRGPRHPPQPADSEPARRLREAMARHHQVSARMCAVDRTKREALQKLQEQHSASNSAVMEYMDRTHRSYQPISVSPDALSGGAAPGAPPLRYNIKKRLISTKPSLKKAAVVDILQRSCLEVLCDPAGGGGSESECDDDERTAVSRGALGLPSSAALRERLVDSIVRLIDQEPRTERMVVRLVRTRQKGARSNTSDSSRSQVDRDEDEDTDEDDHSSST